MVKLVFNENILFEKYKDIVRTCIRDGYALPYLIKSYNIPFEYKLGSKELTSLYNNMDYEVQGILYSMLKNRRKTELSIIKNENPTFDNVYIYHISEVYDFIDKYDQFSKIVVGIEE